MNLYVVMHRRLQNRVCIVACYHCSAPRFVSTLIVLTPNQALPLFGRYTERAILPLVIISHILNVAVPFHMMRAVRHRKVRSAHRFESSS